MSAIHAHYILIVKFTGHFLNKLQIQILRVI